MTKEMIFFLFLIERYAKKCGRSTGDVLREWDEKGVTKEIYDGYFLYHQRLTKTGVLGLVMIVVSTITLNLFG